ncbi:MAG: hypothetical protein HQM14_03435 [SAR324 cluster bacterium]|nr:hypothetical protein [SAR324 cluster bacterium]
MKEQTYGAYSPSAEVKAIINWQFPHNENIFLGEVFSDWDHSKSIVKFFEGFPQVGQTHTEQFHSMNNKIQGHKAA